MRSGIWGIYLGHLEGVAGELSFSVDLCPTCHRHRRMQFSPSSRLVTLGWRVNLATSQVPYRVGEGGQS